mgnify:CR=1 FL=1
MKVIMLESRYIVGIGYKDQGAIFECDDNIAHSIILQGVAEQKKEKKIKHTEGVEEDHQ